MNYLYIKFSNKSSTNPDKSIFLVKARRGEIPVRYKTVPAGDVVGGLIYVYRSFEFRCVQLCCMCYHL